MKSIDMVEVGPRDGLQNEPTLVSTADKVAFIRRAIGAGSKRIEIASFVHPKLVPQMADAEDVVAALGEIDGVTRIGLTLNKRGAHRALDCGIDELGAVCVASDGFGLKNQNADSAQTVLTAKEIIRLAEQEGRAAQVTVSASGAYFPRSWEAGGNEPSRFSEIGTCGLTTMVVSFFPRFDPYVCFRLTDPARNYFAISRISAIASSPISGWVFAKASVASR